MEFVFWSLRKLTNQRHCGFKTDCLRALLRFYHKRAVQNYRSSNLPQKTHFYKCNNVLIIWPKVKFSVFEIVFFIVNSFSMWTVNKIKFLVHLTEMFHIFNRNPAAPCCLKNWASVWEPLMWAAPWRTQKKTKKRHKKNVENLIKSHFQRPVS